MAVAEETILVVEDDDNILELMSYHLKQAGYTVVQAFTGEEAMERARVNRPHLILLDRMLPNMSGLEVCAKLKGDTATRGIPIIIVSARGADADIIMGLEAGADDYIIKPFHPPSFVACVRERLRYAARPQPDPGQDLHYAELILCPEKQEVRLAGDTIALTDREFQVLHYLMRHAGRICTRGQIEAAWEPEADEANAGSIDDQIMSLGKKLGNAGSCIEAVRQLGFRFKDVGS